MQDLDLAPTPNPFYRYGQLLPRDERLVSAELPPAPPGLVCYSGQPVQLSLDQVREKIVWLVSAIGHFEIPQGLPSAISYVASIEELLSVLLAAGWRSSYKAHG